MFKPIFANHLEGNKNRDPIMNTTLQGQLHCHRLQVRKRDLGEGARSKGNADILLKKYIRSNLQICRIFYIMLCQIII